MKKMILADLRQAIESIPHEYDEYPVVIPDNEAGYFEVTVVDVCTLEEGDFYAKELHKNCIFVGY